MEVNGFNLGNFGAALDMAFGEPFAEPRMFEEPAFFGGRSGCHTCKRPTVHVKGYRRTGFRTTGHGTKGHSRCAP